MKKLSIVLLLLSSSIINCYAGDDFSALAEVKKRKLVVVLLEENPEAIDKLTKDGKSAEIETYKQNIKKDNEITTASFKEFWKETPLEFTTESKVKEFTPEQLIGMTLLSHEAASIEKVEFLMYDVCLAYNETSKKGKTTFDLYHKFFKFAVENDVPAPADLLLLLHKIRVYYDLDKEFDLKTLDAKLAKKTLLIDKDATEISKEDIKDTYEFPFKLVSAAEINTAKNSRDKSSVYLKLDVYREGGQQAFLIVDCETGQILSRSLMGGISKVSFNYPSSKAFDSTGQLRSIDKNLSFRSCSSCGMAGGEIFRLYTARARLKKSILKVLASQKIQNSNMFSVGLIPN